MRLSTDPQPEPAAERPSLRARAAGWFRALPPQLARSARAHLLGLGLLDAVYFVTLFTFGSYFLIDTPLNFLLFAFYFWLVTSEHPRRRKFALFVMMAVIAILAATGLVIPWLPRTSPPSVYLRVVHQTAARYAILIVMPYLIRHLRTPLDHRPASYRWSTRIAWLTTKVSIWLAAIPALLTIRGQLTAVHTRLLVIAAPFLAYHVLAPLVWRRRAARASGGAAGAPAVEVQPFSVYAVGSPRLACGAVAAGVAAVAAAAWFRIPSSWANYAVPDFMVSAPSTTFAPSPAHTARGAGYQPALLGESNGCGQGPCHPDVFNEWRRSSHHERATGEPYRAEVERVTRSAGLGAARLCAGCHDPIALFAGAIAPGAVLVTPESLREGISCLVCHGLSPASSRPANGSNRFRFPDLYFVGPVTLPTLVGGWREHRRELHAPGMADDRVCVGCHRFAPLPGALASEPALAGWLAWDVHAQPRMREECRGERGCVACHMPRFGPREKPWGGNLPYHHFDLAGMSAGAYVEPEHQDEG